FAKSVAGRPASYAAVLRMKSDSSSSSVLNPRTRQRQDRVFFAQDWTPFSRQSFSALSFQEDDQSEESEEFGPVFIQEPDDAIFSLDSDDKKVIMNCEARGNPAPTYSWLINGTDVDIEADPRYRMIDGNLIIINASEATDFGKYQCRAENSFGTVLSREAFLQFAYLNAFSGRARGGVSVREGQGVVLMCMPPPHSPEIIYSWVFNEFPSFVAEDSRRFVSQQTGNLYISKVQPSDVGSYICLVKNTVTNARVLSPPTPLTLRTDGVMGEYEPKIEVHFLPTVLMAKGVTVRLECFALGNPVPTITWRKINGNIPKKARLRKSQAVLEIPNIQLDDAGSYECKADNSRGGTSFRGHVQVYNTSSSFSGGILRHSQVSRETWSLQHVLDLSWGLFPVRRPGGIRNRCPSHLNCPLSMWRSSSSTPSSSRVTELLTLSLRERPATLWRKLISAQPYLGSYPFGHDPELMTIVRPQWISLINDSQLDSGDQLHWECRATGKPRPSYHWLRNGEPLNTQPRMDQRHLTSKLSSLLALHLAPSDPLALLDWSHHLSGKKCVLCVVCVLCCVCDVVFVCCACVLCVVCVCVMCVVHVCVFVVCCVCDVVLCSGVQMLNGELIIQKVQLGDSGMYQCVAENKYGTLYSNAELKILASAPVFSSNTATVIATVSKDASLECRPRASPKPRITWRKGDRKIQSSRR
ncbi:hypothetical protein QTP70_032423, partial [Hemibagrus guttatus]